MTDDSEDPPYIVSRRELLKRVGVASAAAALPVEVLAQAAARPRAPLETLSDTEADVLDAIVARLIPTDANGPGATEARAARYIDRALGGALSASRDAYRAGLAAVDAYARSTKGGPFAQLSATESGRRAARPGDGRSTGLHTERGILLQPRPGPHDSGHVRRSLLRRQRQLRRLGFDRLPGRAIDRHAQRATSRCRAGRDTHVRLRLHDVLEEEAGESTR